MYTVSCEFENVSAFNRLGMDELLKDYDRSTTVFKPTESRSIRLTQIVAASKITALKYTACFPFTSKKHKKSKIPIC